jgi:hypothetical protein
MPAKNIIMYVINEVGMACIKKKTVTLELLVKENQLGAVSQ